MLFYTKIEILIHLKIIAKFNCSNIIHLTLAHKPNSFHDFGHKPNRTRKKFPQKIGTETNHLI